MSEVITPNVIVCENVENLANEIKRLKEINAKLLEELEKLCLHAGNKIGHCDCMDTWVEENCYYARKKECSVWNAIQKARGQG